MRGLEDFPKEAAHAVTLIDRLFEIEAKATNVAHLIELRKTESRAIIDELREWLYQTKPRFLPSEGISKAILYCLKNWTELIHFLSDLSVPLSNNDAERALRHAVLGRKNFHGSKTINGADTAATLYTVIETCKRNLLQPSEYLKYVITEHWHKRIPKTPMEYACNKLGRNPKVQWPSRENWKI